MRIQYVRPQIRNATTNWTTAMSQSICLFKFAVGHMYSGLSNAVHVDEPCAQITILFIPRLKSAYLKSLPAEDYMPQSMRFRAFGLGGDKEPKGTGRLVENCHLFTT